MSGGLTLLRACKPSRLHLGRLGFWLAVECLPSFAAGISVADATEALLASRPTLAAAWLSALAVAIVIGTYATRRAYALIGPSVESLRDNLMTAVVRGSLAECQATGRPGVATVTQTIEQVDRVRNLVSAVSRSLRSTIGPMVSAVVGLILLDARLGLAVTAPIGLALIGQTLLVRAAVDRQRSTAVSREAFGADVAEVISDLSGLRGIGADRWGCQHLRAGSNTVAAAERKMLRTATARHAVVVAGTQVPLLVLLVVSAPLLRQHTISAATVLGAATYVLAVLGPAILAISSVSGGWIVELLITIERLSRVASVGEPPSPGRVPTPSDEGVAIELREVTFRYREESRPILDDFDLSVRVGTSVVVLGASGCGKSTLARLISGLQAPTSGSVQVAGPVCYVPQETYVFAGSLRENLLYLTTAPTDSAVSDAVDRFGLDELVSRVGGLDTELTCRDARLTAADRQRVVLARAWLSDAGVVILDEATSMLAAAEEDDVLDQFRGGGRTVVVIAHRVDSARRADQVVWFDGEAAFAGGHRQLLHLLPSYAELHHQDGGLDASRPTCER